MYCEPACDAAVLKESANALAKSQIGVLAITRIHFPARFRPRGRRKRCSGGNSSASLPRGPQWVLRNLSGDWQDLFPRFARAVSITSRTQRFRRESAELEGRIERNATPFRKTKK